MLVDLFNLPECCCFEILIPKNQFEKEFHLSASEQRLLRTSYLPLKAIFSGSLRTDLSSIPSVRTDIMDYEDLLFIEIVIRSDHFDKYSDPLLRLYQKYIPKPLVLLLRSDDRFIINTALKRYNEADSDMRSIKEMMTTPVLKIKIQEGWETLFLEKVRYENIEKQDLRRAYESYCQAVAALEMAAVTGEFRTSEDSVSLHRKTRRLTELEKEMNILRNKIRKTQNLREKITYKMEFRTRKEEYKMMMKKLKA